MNEINVQEIEPEEFDEEFPEEIPDKARPKIKLNERKNNFQIYAN